jgi:hypothetical protein
MHCPNARIVKRNRNYSLLLLLRALLRTLALQTSLILSIQEIIPIWQNSQGYASTISLNSSIEPWKEKPESRGIYVTLEVVLKDREVNSELN